MSAAVIFDLREDFVRYLVQEIPPYRGLDSKNEERHSLLGSNSSSIPPYSAINKPSAVSAESPRSAMSSGGKDKKKGKSKGYRVTIVEADHPISSSSSSSGSSGRSKRSRMFRLVYNYCQLSSFQVCIIAGLFVFVVTFLYAFLRLSQSFLCLGPPYLYVSYKGSKNVIKFSRDGCLIHEKVLWGIPESNIELRSMKMASFKGEEVMYVSGVGTNNSPDPDLGRIFLFGTCLQHSSIRQLLKTVVSSDTNQGAKHPYGLEVDRNGHLYASFQHTDVVLRFNSSNNFRPMKLPDGLESIYVTRPADSHNNSFESGDSDDSTQDIIIRRRLEYERRHVRRFFLRRKLESSPAVSSNSSNNSSTSFNSSLARLGSNKSKGPFVLPYFNGTFVQFGAVGPHKSSERGVRAILWTKNFTELWIANEDLDSVLVVDKNGRFIYQIPARKPIGLHSREDLSVVFVGSKGNKKTAVYSINKKTFKVEQSYKLLGLNHPTGIESYEDVLLVADQSRNVVVSFNITSGRFSRVVISADRLEGDVEQLALSSC